MSKRTPAEQMGIVIGKAVVREDWRSSEAVLAEWKWDQRSCRWVPRANRMGKLMFGALVVRDNHITLAGSNDDSPVFDLWQVEQPPELLAA